MATTTTFANLQADFFFAGFDEYNDAGTGLALAKRMLNQSYLELCSRANFDFLMADATGTAPLSITDVREVLSVTDSTLTVTLPWEDRRTLLDAYGELTTTGNPGCWYYESGTSLATYPVTTDTLVVRYLKKPAALVNDGDVCVVPDEWCFLVVQGAVLKGKKNDDNYDSLWQIHEQEIGRMIDAETQRGDGPQVQLLTDSALS